MLGVPLPSITTHVLVEGGEQKEGDGEGHAIRRMWLRLIRLLGSNNQLLLGRKAGSLLKDTTFSKLNSGFEGTLAVTLEEPILNTEEAISGSPLIPSAQLLSPST